MIKRRTIGWFSCGAASAVAVKLALQEYPRAIAVYCETGAEHPDNSRFMKDCEDWFGSTVKRIRSSEYRDTWDVWRRRKYLSGIYGAPCSTELKVSPRLLFQRPTDIHVFGYTADATDVARASRFRANFPELTVKTPLIERGLTKVACLTILRKENINAPAMYGLGFQNNNCIPCVKATSPAYWALIRKTFPKQFARMARLSRQLGARLCRINNKRMFIDEIPPNYPTASRTSLSCDFLCQIAASMAKEEESNANDRLDSYS